jgi:hypothetical protein
VSPLSETILEILKVHVKAAEAVGKMEVALGLMDALGAIQEEILAAESPAERKAREAAFFRRLRLTRGTGRGRRMRAVREGAEGEVYPEFLCDVCHEPITDFAMANMVWFTWLRREGQTCKLYFVHKIPCDEQLQLEHGDAVSASHAMDHAFGLLAERLARLAGKIP